MSVVTRVGEAVGVWRGHALDSRVSQGERRGGALSPRRSQGTRLDIELLLDIGLLLLSLRLLLLSLGCCSFH